VPASIADLVLQLPSPVFADAESASREIARFDAELGGEIAPFAAVLLRSESAASSQIENLTATARAIGEAELPGGRARRNGEMIVVRPSPPIGHHRESRRRAAGTRALIRIVGHRDTPYLLTATFIQYARR
jgi:hypothetical protein